VESAFDGALTEQCFE
jgi:hypothetical protein